MVHPTVAAKSMQELVKLIQASPKKFSMATPGIGTTPDLSATLLKLTTKLDYPTVLFNGVGPVVVALLGNQGSRHQSGLIVVEQVADTSRRTSVFADAGLVDDLRHAGDIGFYCRRKRVRRTAYRFHAGVEKQFFDVGPV